MKKTHIFYWIVTGLFAAFMIFSAIPEIMNTEQSVNFMNHLGYPPYFNPFIGVAKLLGIIAILIPGYPRIKEWAYAGLSFDLLGATYSLIASDGLQPGVSFMLLPIIFLVISYMLYHKRKKDSAPQ
jgi:hypothetical protein